MSARAREIILKFISMKEQSILEFMMALAFGRMRLCADDAKRITEIASKELPDDERAKSLLTMITAIVKKDV